VKSLILCDLAKNQLSAFGYAEGRIRPRFQRGGSYPDTMISKKKRLKKISLNEIALNRVKFGAFPHPPGCEVGYSNIASCERTSAVATLNSP
jgi:hypothetical protein